MHTVIARQQSVKQCFYFNFEVNKMFWLNVIAYTSRAHTLSGVSQNKRASLQTLLSSLLPSHLSPGQMRKQRLLRRLFSFKHSKYAVPKILGEICAKN